jgi:hypothetical protein
MKKVLILLLTVLLLCGCVNINKSSIDTIINEAVTSNKKIYNTYRTGYKFYLPEGLYITSSSGYNESITDGNNTYYLYIDIVSYLNNVTSTYDANSNSYYSKPINSGDKSGYIEINLKNDKYLVEIMYNYAKIEVMIDEDEINDAVTNAIIVLSSMHYNDNILNNLSNENVLNYNEETVDIFKTNGSESSNFLEYVEEYDSDEEDAVPDYDLIN